MKRKLHSTACAVESVAGLPLFDSADQREAEAKRRGEQSLKVRIARLARWARRQARAHLIRRTSRR